ncbi:MAG: hypothetical protein KGJ32_12855 [Xanthomonadaceae bacterium]|nr:hypothetical protein [Xanthomonadaceae bacterium]
MNRAATMIRESTSLRQRTVRCMPPPPEIPASMQGLSPEARALGLARREMPATKTKGNFAAVRQLSPWRAWTCARAPRRLETYAVNGGAPQPA